MERAASVRETISRSLNANNLGSYMGQAEPVVTALEEREVYLAGEIADAAEENGMARRDTLGVLAEIGMSVPGGGNGTGGDADFTRIEHQLRQIQDELAAARQRRLNR